ncbi:MAG: sodium/glutamate symporter [Pseudomonadota bacterium]
MEPQPVIADDFLAYTAGIIVYFVGMALTSRLRFLREYNIPEPVTGGLLASLAILAVFLATDIAVGFELETRDRLLVYFFTTIGLNARVSDLISGGRPLLILLGLTLGFIFLQNIVGVGAATLAGRDPAIGVLAGSASLIGGHGTAIAWAPEIAARNGVANALEIGVAAATLGLVMASLLGGPIAKLLLARGGVPPRSEEVPVVGLPRDREAFEQITHISIMSVILTIHLAIIIGYFVDLGFAALGLKLPLFVSCLLAAIALSNTVPLLLPRMKWPARTKALALVSDFSLGLFIAMSLMSMQLWTVADLAGPLLLILAAQAAATVAFILLVFFPLMGRDYQAIVLSSGFAGFALGATPTAIANMTAVTKTHGPAPNAFIILPLVGAFFVDITNAVAIQLFLAL